MFNRNLLCTLIASALLVGCGGSNESGRVDAGERPQYETPIKKLTKSDLEYALKSKVVESKEDVLNSQVYTLGKNYYGDKVSTYQNVKVISRLNGKKFTQNSVATVGNTAQEYINRLAYLVAGDSVQTLMMSFNEKGTILGLPYHEKMPVNRFAKTLVAYNLLSYYNGASTVIPHDPEVADKDELGFFIAIFESELSRLGEPTESAISAAEIGVNSLLHSPKRTTSISSIETYFYEAWKSDSNYIDRACSDLARVGSSRLYEHCDSYDEMQLDFLKLKNTRGTENAQSVEFHAMEGGECSDCSVVRDDRILLPTDIYERDYFNRMVISKGIIEQYIRSLPWGGIQRDLDAHRIPWVLEGAIENMAWSDNVSFQRLSELTDTEIEQVFDGTYEGEDAKSVYSTIIAYLTGNTVQIDPQEEEVIPFAAERHAKFVLFLNKLREFKDLEHETIRQFMENAFDDVGFVIHKAHSVPDGEAPIPPMTFAEFKRDIRFLSAELIGKEYRTFTQDTFTEQ